MLDRNFSDPCITGAVIASSFLVWTGSFSSHYLWCNDSIQMGKSDQVESELWFLIRSSCSMEAESLSLGLKSSLHKFHILKSIVNLWRYKCRNNKFGNGNLCLSYHKWILYLYCSYWEKIMKVFSLMLAYRVLFFFLAFNIFPGRKLSTNKALFLQLLFSKFWLKQIQCHYYTL